MMRLLTLIAALALACRSAPETKIQIQGTVTAVGYGTPVGDADVLVVWPRAWGGGETAVRTTSRGQYALSRTMRTGDPDCSGLTLTVRATGYASAYARRDSTQTDCGDGVLTMDFKLFPLQ